MSICKSKEGAFIVKQAGSCLQEHVAKIVDGSDPSIGLEGLRSPAKRLEDHGSIGKGMNIP